MCNVNSVRSSHSRGVSTQLKGSKEGRLHTLYCVTDCVIVIINNNLGLSARWSLTLNELSCSVRFCLVQSGSALVGNATKHVDSRLGTVVNISLQLLQKLLCSRYMYIVT